MKVRYLVTILTALLIMTGCSRTMMLNQTATTLDKREKETTFKNNLGATLFACYPSPLLTFGVQHRVGLKENVEFQFLFDTNLHIVFTGAVQFSNHFDWQFKFRALESNKVEIAFLPYFGLKQYIGISETPFSWSPHPGVPIGLGLGPTIGLKTIFSHNLAKKPVAIYYGFGVDLSENLLLLANLQRSYSFNNNLPFMDITIGLSFGVEVYKVVVTRHEIGLTTCFDLASSHSPGYSNSFTPNMPSFPTFTLSYMFAIGGRYGGKYANRPKEKGEDKPKIDWSE